MPELAVNKNSRSFHIGQNAGLIISSAAAFSFAIAVSGWIILKAHAVASGAISILP